jgi:hypothetical protein
LRQFLGLSVLGDAGARLGNAAEALSTRLR